MDISTQTKLLFDSVDIVQVRFNSYRQNDFKEPINLDIVPKVFYPKDIPEEFKIIMDVKLDCKNFFDLKLIALGYFKLGKDIDSEEKKNLVNTNAVAIMFPYVRAFISTLTSNLGNVSGRIIIPSQFFQGELEVIVENDSDSEGQNKDQN